MPGNLSNDVRGEVQSGGSEFVLSFQQRAFFVHCMCFCDDPENILCFQELDMPLNWESGYLC